MVNAIVDERFKQMKDCEKKKKHRAAMKKLQIQQMNNAMGGMNMGMGAIQPVPNEMSGMNGMAMGGMNFGGMNTGGMNMGGMAMMQPLNTGMGGMGVNPVQMSNSIQGQSFM